MKYTNKKIQQKVIKQIFNALLEDYSENDVKQVLGLRNEICDIANDRGELVYLININGLGKSANKKFVYSIIDELMNLLELTDTEVGEQLNYNYRKYGYNGLKLGEFGDYIDEHLRNNHNIFAYKYIEDYKKGVKIYESHNFKKYVKVCEGYILDNEELKVAFLNNSPQNLEKLSTKDITNKIEKQHDSEETCDYYEAIVLTLYLKKYRNEEFNILLNDHKLSSFYQAVNDEWHLDNSYN